METQFAWNVTQQVELTSAYTWAQAYYNNYTSTSCTKGKVCTTTSYTGTSYQAMPTNHLNLRVTYKPLPGLRIALDGDYISQYYIDTANSGTYQRPTIFNLRSSYVIDKQWTATLHILNLGNVQYADKVGASTNGNPATIIYNSMGNSGSYEPLTVRAGVTYKF
jgi:outer membrane receptor protein involved in Fe transport